jgi:cell division protein FtsI/penicillin-binding protein 2
VRRWGKLTPGRAVVGTCLVLVTNLLAACGSSSDSPDPTVAAFVAAWNRGDWAAMSRYVNRPAASFTSSGPAITADLHSSGMTHSAGAVTRVGGTATVPVVSQYVLPGLPTWEVHSTLTLARHSGRWLVDWSPAVIEPHLQPDGRLELTRTWAPRAPILGAGGTPLTEQGPAFTVGVEGSRIKDPAAVSAALTGAGASAAQVGAALAAAAAHPTYFEPVFTLPQATFQHLGGQNSDVYRVSGTLFQPTDTRAAITPGLAAHLVGSVGPITAEQLTRLGPAYDSGSIVGQAGLEAAYQAQLAGKPGDNISAVNAGGRSRTTVATFSPGPGSPVQTSIDATVQQAAEAALTGVASYAALVAVRASTGQVLADVSVPAAYQFDQGLSGAFPPGSTFKVITASALIEKGLTPASAASCPPSLVVDGESFHNAEGDAPTSDLAGAFAESCNTAFIGLAAADLQFDSLPASARGYNIGISPHMGMPAFGGQVPTPSDTAGLAQTAIGQARVVVSPLAMAMVAAAVDSGTVRAPRLVSGAPDDTAPNHPLPPAVTAGLQQMMALVVTAGTAAGTGLPAGTHAKTGTAEYGTGSPQPTDAWLIGYQGDLAFAMVLQGTGNGGPTDGPIVARFLTALGSAS